MYHIHQLNKISPKGTALLTEAYTNTDSIEEADGILVRSANMHDMELPEIFWRWPVPVPASTISP